ncbi:armadillo repeat-containing protein 6 homolog [Melitaea cinxia]|uniref:armadillo repeat-containing protein 6 homolog n=1 Tax=Melitaea cinxia TaxID=113334 RepID=UPI001E274CB4|nr:armadillo repeat-containing protein 6 homolog [Melitaea cinxia]
MVRVITQDTYDEVVKENIEEFDMTPEEAIKEAVAQFEAQGVDLSNIIKDLALSSGENHLISVAVEKLKEISSKSEYDDNELLKELDILMAECKKDIAHRVRAGKEGAYGILIDLLESKLKLYKREQNSRNELLVTTILKSLTALMEMQPDLLDDKAMDIIKNILDSEENENVLVSTLQWISVCCLKHEMNRQGLTKDITNNLKELLKNKENKKLLSETLQVIRRLTLDDDIRVEFGKAHEHARDLGINLLDTLSELLDESNSPTIVCALLQTTAALLVRHELCARVRAALGPLLAAHYDDAHVAHHAARLITALAGNDDVKRELVKTGLVPIVVSLLRRHSSNPTTTASMLKCVSALCLREASHGRAFLEHGVADVVVECLNIHENVADVQKNGCWAVRNMVARYRDHNAKLRELGIEAVLQRAYDKFADQFGFDIKSALRDLDCDVKFDEQWKGRGVQMER